MTSHIEFAPFYGATKNTGWDDSEDEPYQTRSDEDRKLGYTFGFLPLHVLYGYSFLYIQDDYVIPSRETWDNWEFIMYQHGW